MVRNIRSLGWSRGGMLAHTAWLCYLNKGTLSPPSPPPWQRMLQVLPAGREQQV